MASINKAIIVGNLGRDPEARYTQGGTAVCTLSIATTRSYTNKANERVEETEWHRVVVWGKTAEACSQHLAKGRQVYVEGRLQTRSYDDKDGVKKYTTEIVADVVQFLGSRVEREPTEQPARGNSQRPTSGEYDYVHADHGDDDIPF